MKNVKPIFLLFILLLAIACNDKNDDDSTVLGDALVVSKKSGNNTVYALTFYAYAYSSLKSVKVTGVVNPISVDLSTTGNYSSAYFVKEPTDNDFSTTKPSPDTFTFNAEFENGNKYVAQDILTADILEPVTIETCKYNVTNARAEFIWTALSNADSYSISIIDESGNQVFMSNTIANSYTKVYLESNTTGWKTGDPIAGKTYTVRFFAYKFEDSNNPDSYNVQSTSYSQATLVWGQ